MNSANQGMKMERVVGSNPGADDEQIYIHLNNGLAGKQTLLKVEIDKLPDSDSGWRIENISRFTDFDQDWPQYLNQFRT